MNDEMQNSVCRINKKSDTKYTLYIVYRLDEIFVSSV